MRIKFSAGREPISQDVEIRSPHPDPVIRITSEEIDDRSHLGVATIEIENAEGEFARFWVNVSIRRGRPVVEVSTKPDKERRKQVSKKIQGAFNML